jgi:hypothetical protein
MFFSSIANSDVIVISSLSVGFPVSCPSGYVVISCYPNNNSDTVATGLNVSMSPKTNPTSCTASVNGASGLIMTCAKVCN